MRVYAIVIASLFVSGCMTAQERGARLAASEDAACRPYGASGTPAYAQCRIQRDQARERQRAALLGVAIANRPQPVQPYVMPTQPTNRQINCTSTRAGNAVTTNCY